jgi:hypothetical protein
VQTSRIDSEVVCIELQYTTLSTEWFRITGAASCLVCFDMGAFADLENMLASTIAKEQPFEFQLRQIGFATVFLGELAPAAGIFGA